jgi:hypothetical protein
MIPFNNQNINFINIYIFLKKIETFIENNNQNHVQIDQNDVLKRLV